MVLGRFPPGVEACVYWSKKCEELERLFLEAMEESEWRRASGGERFAGEEEGSGCL
jgi:hypothetical protein